MDERDKLHKMAEQYKAEYPSGTRIMLLSMGNSTLHAKDNTRGTVIAVDDRGTLHCDFGSGAMIGVVPGKDSFRKLTGEELAEEQEPKTEEGMEEHEDFYMKM
ncbi:DUF4314 domain-containing protein [Acutalibacter muris]|uniref:DUF4314 domain-containing protein n=1 Tax=Acutalibacter muris TaxID=1796620 RepID=UPI00272DFB97|nr:DUF4314 domain-containing protein [Acutalibacter muris]